MKMKLLCTLGLMALISSSLVFAQTTSTAKRISIAPDDDVRLVYAEGVISMNGKTVDIGTVIPDDAVVKTSKDGIAEIAFKTKNVIRLGPNTIVHLSLSKLKRDLTIDQGAVTGVFRNLEKIAGGGLTLHTPTVVGGVRGTSLCTWVDTDGRTYFCSCNGSIQVDNPAGTDPFVQEAAHHKAFWFKKQADGTFVKKEGVQERHTDKDLETLASRIDEKIDWSTIDK